LPVARPLSPAQVSADSRYKIAQRSEQAYDSTVIGVKGDFGNMDVVAVTPPNYPHQKPVGINPFLAYFMVLDTTLHLFATRS
jgi:hypothetical protein